MLRPLRTTQMARGQWMPEAILGCLRHVASFSHTTATVADATLRLGGEGCILVHKASHFTLRNVTIQGVACRVL